jgi:hypothetical protein
VVVAGVVHAAEEEGDLAARRCDAQNIPAGQVKVGVGGEGSTGDLRCRGRLKGRQVLLETRGAIIGGRLEPQDGGKGTAMNDALASMVARLEAQGVDVRTPGGGSQRPISHDAMVTGCATGQPAAEVTPGRASRLSPACETSPPTPYPTPTKTPHWQW